MLPLLISPITIVTLENWPSFLQELPAPTSSPDPPFTHKPVVPYRFLVYLALSLGTPPGKLSQGQCSQAPENSSHGGRLGKVLWFRDTLSVLCYIIKGT